MTKKQIILMVTVDLHQMYKLTLFVKGLRCDATELGMLTPDFFLGSTLTLNTE